VVVVLSLRFGGCEESERRGMRLRNDMLAWWPRRRRLAFAFYTPREMASC
jgi:hypothetical protein